MIRTAAVLCFKSALLAATLAIAGCSLFVPWNVVYSGDGTYEAVRGSQGRDQVRLVPLPLDRSSSACSTITHLGPEQEWTVAVRLEPDDGDVLDLVNRLWDKKKHKLKSQYIPQSTLRLTLTDESNKLLFSVSGPLEQWEWSANRATRSGRGEEYESSPGTWQFRRFDVGPDEAWGTSFTPRFSGTYSLCYTITNPAPMAKGVTPWLTVERYFGFL